MKKIYIFLVTTISLIVAGCSNDVENEKKCKEGVIELNSSVDSLMSETDKLSQIIKGTKWVSDKDAQLSDLDFITKGAKLHAKDVEKMLTLKQYSNCISFSNQLVKLNNGVNQLLNKTENTILNIELNKDKLIKESNCKIDKKCENMLNDKVRDDLVINTSKIQEEVSLIVSELQKMTIDLSKPKTSFKSKISN